MNQVITGDCIAEMNKLPDSIVQTCITSPPYWGLRDYGVEGQFGLEKTPEIYVAKMVDVFRAVRRVLRDDGTLFLNLGDSYVSGKGRYSSNAQTISGKSRHEPGQGQRPDQKNHPYLKDKDLCMIPARVALALQADGWWLRSDIIWAKPNPMPESVTDRPTKSYEHIFMLTKSAKYYTDMDAVREETVTFDNSIRDRDNTKLNNTPGRTHMDGLKMNNYTSRNLRDVWNIATQPCRFAHFATFPEELVNKCILMGTADRACGICGAAWERVVEHITGKHNHQASQYQREKSKNVQSGGINSTTLGGIPGTNKTLGFRPSCSHNDDSGKCIVLDPFGGTGTVAYRAQEMGRKFIHIDISEKYNAYARTRLAQGVIL